MGKRRDEKAYNLVRRGNRKRLRHLLGKHEELRTSNDAILVSAAIWHNRGMLYWLLERGVSPDCCGESDGGNTPLMHAASEGDIPVMKLLLGFGADPNALNEESENALGFSVSWKQLEAIKLLVAAGADVNNTDDSGPDRTQLDSAKLSEWTERVAVLRTLGGKRYADLISEAETA